MASSVSEWNIDSLIINSNSNEVRSSLCVWLWSSAVIFLVLDIQIHLERKSPCFLHPIIHAHIDLCLFVWTKAVVCIIAKAEYKYWMTVWTFYSSTSERFGASVELLGLTFREFLLCISLWVFSASSYKTVATLLWLILIYDILRRFNILRILLSCWERDLKIVLRKSLPGKKSEKSRDTYFWMC